MSPAAAPAVKTLAKSPTMKLCAIAMSIARVTSSSIPGRCSASSRPMPVLVPVIHAVFHGAVIVMRLAGYVPVHGWVRRPTRGRRRAPASVQGDGTLTNVEKNRALARPLASTGRCAGVEFVPQQAGCRHEGSQAPSPIGPDAGVGAIEIAGQWVQSYLAIAVMWAVALPCLLLLRQRLHLTLHRPSMPQGR